MPRSVAVLLLLLFATFCIAQKPLPHVPKLPEQFSMGVEVNVLHANATKHVKIFFDKPGERARIDVYGESIVKTLVDFNKNEEWVIYGKGKCSSGKASDSYLADPNDNTKMMSADQLFHWSQGQNYEYQGVEEVRGIPADHWSTEETKDEGMNRLRSHHHGEDWKNIKSVSYSLHWYFSASNWKIYNGETDPERAVPLRAVVEGTKTMSDDTTRKFSLSYDIMWVSEGKPCDSKFKIAQWYHCENLPEPTLPSLPDSFECAVEMTSLSRNFTTSWYSWVDGENDRARISTSWKGTKITKIVWEDKGKWFKIKDHQCTAKDINKNFDPFGDGQGHLISTEKMFGFGKDTGQSYHGRREVRGILCDHWVSEQTQSWFKYDFNYTLHWYFSTADWKMIDTGASRVPVQAEMYGTVKKGSNWSDDDNGDEEQKVYRHHYNFDEFADEKGLIHFHHIYDVVHFLPKEPKHWLFDPTKWTHGCEDYKNKDGDHDDDGDCGDDCGYPHDGWPYVTVALIAGILGVLLGVVVGSFFLRKRAERRFQNQQQFVGMAG